MRQHTGYIALSWIYSFLTLLLTTNRVYIHGHRRHFGRNSLSKWSDGLVVAAWMFVVAQNCCDTVLYFCDSLVDITSLDKNDPANQRRIATFWKFSFAENAIYYVPVYCIKGAILLFLVEITPPILTKIRKAIWIGIALCVLGLLYTAVAMVFFCNPVRGAWDYFAKADCAASAYSTRIVVVWHMLTDVYIYTIPFCLIRYLPARVSIWQRLATYIMFGAGFFIVCIAFMQLGSFWQPVVMWDFWWGVHEQNLAITLACLPALRMTLQEWRHVYSSDRRGSADGGHRRRSLREQRGELSTIEVAQTRKYPENKQLHTADIGVQSSEFFERNTGAF